MAKQTSSAASGGIGFAGLLTVAFIVLKLTSVISWSWWWILAPLWLPAALLLAFAAFAFIYTGIKMRKGNEDLYKW